MVMSDHSDIIKIQNKFGQEIHTLLHYISVHRIIEI